MQIQKQIITVIGTTLKNPIYQTIRFIGIKTIPKQARLDYNFPIKIGI